MPRRVEARWGRLGMVRLDGFGKIDDRTQRNHPEDPSNGEQSEQSSKDRGRQGFLLNDSQFDSLRRAVELSDESPRCAQFRMDLNFIRGFVLTSFLQNSEKP